jgi:hypothetical protein
MNRRKSIRYGLAFVSAAVLFALTVPIGSGALYAQEYTGPHEVKWIRVGDLRQWYTDAGMEVEYGLIPRAMAQGTQQADEMMWEALYYRTDTQCSRGLWIGATNFADPISGRTYPFKVVQAGPRFINTLTNFMPTSFKMTGRFAHPIVTVDGADGTDNTLDDVVDDIVPNQPETASFIRWIRTSGSAVPEPFTIQPGNDDSYSFTNRVQTPAWWTPKAPRSSNADRRIFSFVNCYAGSYTNGDGPPGNKAGAEYGESGRPESGSCSRCGGEPVRGFRSGIRFRL